MKYCAGVGGFPPCQQEGWHLRVWEREEHSGLGWNPAASRMAWTPASCVPRQGCHVKF